MKEIQYIKAVLEQVDNDEVSVGVGLMMLRGTLDKLIKSNPISTTERIFRVTPNFDMGKSHLCNLDGLKAEILRHNSIKKVEHYWNGKFQRFTKKAMREMFEANGVDYSDFYYLS